jgi:hypothetical protein
MSVTDIKLSRWFVIVVDPAFGCWYPVEVRLLPTFRGPYCLYHQASPEDGGNMFLWNVGIYLQVHAALQPTRPTSTSSQPWEPQISYHIDHNVFLRHSRRIQCCNVPEKEMHFSMTALLSYIGTFFVTLQLTRARKWKPRRRNRHEK